MLCYMAKEKVADGIKVAKQLTLRKSILDYQDGPNLIKNTLKSVTGKKKWHEKLKLSFASFEDGGGGQ